MISGDVHSDKNLVTFMTICCFRHLYRLQSGGVASQALSFALSRIMDGGVISCLVACQCGKWDVPKVNGGVDGSDILQSTLNLQCCERKS